MKNKAKTSQGGSALVLTVIVLVTALVISLSISVISVMERKISSKARNSTPAFQAADSGLDWALRKINDSYGPETLADVFPDPDCSFDTSTGEINCSGGDAPNVDFSLFFIDRDSQIMRDAGLLVRNIYAIRSIGRSGLNEEEVNRSLEAYAAPNCPNVAGAGGFETISVGDFCVQNDDSQSETWSNAYLDCVDFNGRLCSAGELFAACESGSLTFNDDEWTDTVTNTGEAIIVSDDCSTFGAANMGNTNDFRCCFNR